MCMTRIVFFLLGLVGLVLPGQAQYLVKGTLYDSKTQEVLSFAPVVPLPSQKGTMTNGEGYYEVRSKEPVQQIQATYMGYGPQTVSVPDPSQKEQMMDVFLVPLPIMLQEVEVSPQYPEDLIKALYRSQISRASEHYYAEALIRSSYTLNGVPYLATEQIYVMDINQRGIGECKFLQGRVAQSQYSYDRISRYFLCAPSVTHIFRRRAARPRSQADVSLDDLFWPINAHPGRHIAYKIVGTKMLNGETITIITFKSILENIPFSGKMEVIEDKLQIVSLEVSRKRTNGSYDNEYWHYNQYAGVWRLESIDIKRTAYQNMAIVANYHLFLYNHNVSSKEYQKISPDVKIGIDWLDMTPVDDLPYIRNTAYDSTFWGKRKSIISEIPFEQSVQQSLVSDGFYGNLFPNGLTVPKTQVPECSDFQNQLLEQVGIFYRYSWAKFLSFLPSAPEHIINRFFIGEVWPLCEDYMDRVIRGKVSVQAMQWSLSLMVVDKERTLGDILAIYNTFNKFQTIDLKVKIKERFGNIDYTAEEPFVLERIVY